MIGAGFSDIIALPYYQGDHLLFYSSIVGDRAYFGFFGEELTPIEAAAGTYRVVLHVGDESYSGRVRVREDPLLSDFGF